MKESKKIPSSIIKILLKIRGFNMLTFIDIENNLGTKVTLCNVGASIYDIKTLDKNGLQESIVYTTKNKDEFPYDNSYFGKTIGRTGGRISSSKFSLNNKDYVIESSDPNGLHGGSSSLAFKEFSSQKEETEDYIKIIFSYYSVDKESGYPGNLDLKVSYTLYKNNNVLNLEYDATCDQDTLLNLSNHTYFNLSGNAKNNILEHQLFINASKMERIEKLIPQEIISCSHIYSFKNMHAIKDNLFNKEIINNTNGYDFPYIFDEVNKNKEQIYLLDPISNRSLSIKTTYPVVVIYTCNYVGEEIMNNNKIAEPYNAVCLEAMYHPNTINSPFLKDKLDVLKKGQKYHEEITYTFNKEEKEC
jgi:aldose 1-epimerase